MYSDGAIKIIEPRILTPTGLCPARIRGRTNLTSTSTLNASPINDRRPVHRPTARVTATNSAAMTQIAV